MHKKTLSTLEEKIEHSFNKKHLIKAALTHPSKKLENKTIETYQRLEFLGDKLLNFIIAHELFTVFPKESEGEISRRHAHLVCGSVCYKIAEELNVFQHIIFSKAQLNDTMRSNSKIGEDVMEAIIGAIFLDSNIQKTEEFVLKHWRPYITQNITPPKDAKSALQEYFQKYFKKIPEYIITTSGLQFTASIKINNTLLEETASTKKEAEKLVAQKCLKHLKQ